MKVDICTHLQHYPWGKSPVSIVGATVIWRFWEKWKKICPFEYAALPE